MKLGILITTYNRPEYLKPCLESIKRAEIPEGTQICISDDFSDNQETIKLINEVFYPNPNVTINRQQGRQGIKKSFLGAMGVFINRGCDTFINLDGDALVRNDFVSVLLKLHEQFPDNLITGFNCNTLNVDGTIRHKILEQGEGWNKKKTVGGINLFFTREMFDKWLLPALSEPVGNWDQKACLNAGNGVICAVPSVVQHIGFESSMGHSGSGRELPDTAEDFKLLHLPNVTLI